MITIQFFATRSLIGVVAFKPTTIVDCMKLRLDNLRHESEYRNSRSRIEGWRMKFHARDNCLNMIEFNRFDMS